MKKNGLFRVAVLIPLLACAGLPAPPAAGQPRHRILHEKNRFYLVDIATGRKKPFDMWVTRLANAAFHPRFTDAVIENLDDYLRYGVNTVVVGLQGGSIGYAKYPRVYNTDGSLDLQSPVWNNVRRLLEETDKRGMVMILQFWHHTSHKTVPDDARALEATRRAAKWLKNTGYRHYVLDIVNEFLHNAFNHRPLFETLGGALKLIEAVKEVDPEVLVGHSPASALLAPLGWLNDPIKGKRWVEADIIYGHNQVVDPMLRGAYKLGVAPKDPRLKPYINNEFHSQIRYERALRTDPRTGRPTYGHWDAATVALVLKELNKLRGYGGYGNVFSQRQQYVLKGTVIPEAVVGPSGTQPEAVSGGGEPSVHWWFRAVARLRKFGPLPATQDFGAGAPGLESRLTGRWAVTGGTLVQTQTTGRTFARMVADEGDLEVSFEAAAMLRSRPGGHVGLHLGGPTPEDGAYRLRLYRDHLTLDQVHGALGPRTVYFANRIRFTLRLLAGRVQVAIGGSRVLDLPDPTPIRGRNLLFVTADAAGVFDNVRVTPLRLADFDDGTTGVWVPDDPRSWAVVPNPQPRGGRWWEASVPAGEVRRAVVDRRIADFSLDLQVNLAGTESTGIVFRAADPTNPNGPFYRLHLDRGGEVRLEHRGEGGPPEVLGAAAFVPSNPEVLALRLTAEGDRFAVRVDGKTVLDLRHRGDVLARGAIALVAHEGTTRYDNVLLSVLPSRLPQPRFLPFTARPLPKGFTIEYRDPDGLFDLARFRLQLDLGNHVFQDITFVLHPGFAVFRPEVPPDAKAVRFVLQTDAPLPPGSTLRAQATDHAGNTAHTDLPIR